MSFVPLYFWRGARPDLVDLDVDQTGWAIMLVLVREGDCCLLPVVWLSETPDEDTEYLRLNPAAAHHFIQSNALDREALDLTLSDLQGDGWQVSGRLDVHFSGRYTDPNFWPHIQTYLWRDKLQPGHDECHHSNSEFS
jgi:hypothetical protein